MRHLDAPRGRPAGRRRRVGVGRRLIKPPTGTFAAVIVAVETMLLAAVLPTMIEMK